MWIRWLIPLVFASLLTCSAARAQSCVGDCDGNGSVGVSELIRCVRIALGEADVETCPECDPGGDGAVAIAELVTAVSHALCDCQTCPTRAPTRTPTPRPPTTTPVPSTRPPTTTPTVSTTACDFNGAWDGEATTVRDTCDDDFPAAPFSVTIAHGADGVLTAPEGFVGTVSAVDGMCCLDFAFVEPDEGGITCNVGHVCQTADGRQFTGSVDWKFYLDPEASCDAPADCSGLDSLTATRR